MKLALRDLETRPDDAGARLLAAGCAIELGDLEAARRNLELLDAGALSGHLAGQLPFFRYALARADRPDAPERAVRCLDDGYLAMGCRPVRVGRARGRAVFDRLTVAATAAPRCPDGHPPLRDGPLVSVVMTACNVERLVGFSVRSILNQGYRNLELIVVDDRSTDGTLEALRRTASGDRRIRVIARDRNGGAFASRNAGLLHAKGEFVAFQDGDDWSHPDRIGKSVAVLASAPGTVALTTAMVRMTAEGALLSKANLQAVPDAGSSGGTATIQYYLHPAAVSLVFRRDEVLRRAGFFDPVRFGSDSEFERRLGVLFGEDRVAHRPWPLTFARVRPGSLTDNPHFRWNSGKGRAVIMRYRRAFRRWHEGIGDKHDGHMPFPLRERPFDAAAAMLADPEPGSAGGRAKGTGNGAGGDASR